MILEIKIDIFYQKEIFSFSLPQTKSLDVFGSCDISLTLLRTTQKENIRLMNVRTEIKVSSSYSTTIECGGMVEEQFN